MISDVGEEITGRVVGSVESMGGIEDDELCELIDNIMLEEVAIIIAIANIIGIL